MSDEELVEAGTALRGLRMADVPSDWSVVGAVILVKCADNDGTPVWAFRTTEGINEEELLGVLVVRTELARKELLDAYEN